MVQISGIREAAPGGHDVFRLSMANGEDSEANDFEKPSVKSLKTARLQTQAKKIFTSRELSGLREAEHFSNPLEHSETAQPASELLMS